MARPPRLRTIVVLVLLVAGARSASAQSGVLGWGWNGYHQTDVPPLPPGRVFVQIAAGTDHSVALLDDGSVLAWGLRYLGNCDVPRLPIGLRYTQVDAGAEHTVALRSDGRIVAFGGNMFRECDVPPLPPGLTYVEVSAGGYHTLARRSDGAVLGWGSNFLGESDVPDFPPGVSCVQIAAAGYWDNFDAHSVALFSDGSVLTWGESPQAPRLPPGTRYVEIDAASYATIEYSLALRSDGVVVEWGSTSLADVPTLPPGMRYTGIAAGEAHALALRSDGAVVSWGVDLGEIPRPPEGLRYVELAAGSYFCLGRVAGCATCELPFCLGDGGPRSEACPCGNFGARGRGCENSAATGGALLAARGSVDPDRVVLTVIGTTSAATNLFVQGSSVQAFAHAFGDGALCIGDNLERLGIRSSSFPSSGDPSISARSAALGDPIAPGSLRYYQVLYRDGAPGFCTRGTFNASNAVMVRW